ENTVRLGRFSPVGESPNWPVVARQDLVSGQIFGRHACANTRLLHNVLSPHTERPANRSCAGREEKVDPFRSAWLCDCDRRAACGSSSRLYCWPVSSVGGRPFQRVVGKTQWPNP